MNVLDTRNLQERLEELEDERTAIEDAIADLQEELDSAEEEAEELKENLEDKQKELQEWDESEEAAELKELQEMADEISEWKHGATLIDENDFEEYCEELCKDIGDLPKNLPGYLVIDWEATANNLRSDYSSIDYQGNTYLYRDC